MKSYIKFFKIILPILFASSVFCFAQQSQFEKIYIFPGQTVLIPFVELPDSGFIMIGRYLQTTELSYIMRLDKNGDSLFTKTYGDGFFAGIELVNDTTIITSSGFWNLYNHGLSTMRMNLNGDTLEYRDYYNIGNAYSGGIVKCTDNGFIMNNQWAGSYNILKLDSNGNEQWHQWNNMWDFATCTKQDPAGGYVTIGGDGNAYQDYNVLRLDDSGAVIWQNSYGMNINGSEFWATDIAFMDDSNYLVSCSGYDYLMLKINRNTGDTIWTKLNPQGNNNIKNLCKVSNNRYLALSTYKLSLFDANGDTIWTRPFPFPIPLAIGGQVIQTKDKGYAYSGYYNYLGGSATVTFFVKTDSLGNTVYTSVFDGISGESILFYPNPATSELYINTSAFANEATLTFTLTDIQGKQVLQQEYDKSKAVDVSNVPNGIYIAEVRGKEKVVREKVVVQH